MKALKGIGLLAGAMAGVAVSATGYTLVAGGPSADVHAHQAESAEASPMQTGPVQVIASGTESGIGWALQVHESSGGLCVDLLLEDVGANSGGGCGFGLVGESPTQTEVIGLGQFWDAKRDVSFAYGPIVDMKANFVDILTDDGTTRRTTVIQGPDDLGFDFYVLRLDNSTQNVERVTALATDGRPLGSRTGSL